MPEESSTNGTATPLSSTLSGLSLAESSGAPTPPSESVERKIPGLSNCGVPDNYLLPNGYPDVRYSLDIPSALLVQLLTHCAE